MSLLLGIEPFQKFAVVVVVGGGGGGQKAFKIFPLVQILDLDLKMGPS